MSNIFQPTGDDQHPVSTGTPIRNQYRTTARHQMDDRVLILRGGPLDNRPWVGQVAVGKRVFCGDGTWNTAEMYLVTDRIELDEQGREANVAVPAFA